MSVRLGECIGQLVTKGCHPTWSTALILTYTNNVLEVVQMESSIPANASSFLPLIVKCLATAVRPSISQVFQIKSVVIFKLHSFVTIGDNFTLPNHI